MDLVKRKEELDNFKLGDAKFLVVTDLCARGIDIPDVEVVINYDFPSQLKTFIHRCGRTARIDREGVSFSLINREETMYLAKLGEVLEYREISTDFSERKSDPKSEKKEKIVTEEEENFNGK
jgi:superfamily II DNA/RNA helicase